MKKSLRPIIGGILGIGSLVYLVVVAWPEVASPHKNEIKKAFFKSCTTGLHERFAKMLLAEPGEKTMEATSYYCECAWDHIEQNLKFKGINSPNIDRYLHSIDAKDDTLTCKSQMESKYKDVVGSRDS
jgi:hypothetical protein